MGITSSSVWVSFFGLRYLSSLQFPLATVVCLSSVYPCLETEKGSVFLRFPNTAREKKKKSAFLLRGRPLERLGKCGWWIQLNRLQNEASNGWNISFASRSVTCDLFIYEWCFATSLPVTLAFVSEICWNLYHVADVRDCKMAWSKYLPHIIWHNSMEITEAIEYFSRERIKLKVYIYLFS